MRLPGPRALLLLLLLVAGSAQLGAQVSVSRLLVGARTWATSAGGAGEGLGATWGWAAFQGQAPDPPVPPLVTAQSLAPAAVGVLPGSGWGKVSLVRKGWSLLGPQEQCRVPTGSESPPSYFPSPCGSLAPIAADFPTRAFPPSVCVQWRLTGFIDWTRLTFI